MVNFMVRLADDDYEKLQALSAVERLPRVEIIRRLIRMEMIYKRQQESQQAIRDEVDGKQTGMQHAV